LDNLAFDFLEADEASLLELPFEEREVFEVVKGMHKDKAPCLNGVDECQILHIWAP
jgi:hypothetical protein